MEETKEEEGMPAPAPDPMAVLRSRSYVGLLVLAAILGVPISAATYGFLALAGVLVGLTIGHLPGEGGHSPADGFRAGGIASPIELPGIAIAALASLGLGVVLGPEAPLIALGGGLAVCAVRLARREVPAQATAVVAAAGSFAAVSTLLGSPLLGAFLLPLTSVLLATLLLASDGLAVMPLVIVAVAVAYVASARLTPAPAGTPATASPAEAPVHASRTPLQ
jgi:hypothetical protein